MTPTIYINITVVFPPQVQRANNLRKLLRAICFLNADNACNYYHVVSLPQKMAQTIQNLSNTELVNKVTCPLIFNQTKMFSIKQKCFISCHFTIQIIKKDK